MIKDEVWEEFLLWCKGQWSQYVPHREDVEIYLSWLETKVQHIDWNWQFHRKQSGTGKVTTP